MDELLRNEKSTEEVALGIRRRVFEHSIRNNGGYMSQACSAAEQLAWLYNEELNLGAPTLPMIPKPFGGVPHKDNPDYHTGAGYNGPVAPDLDRLFIAPAHYALVAYATLIETGRMASEGLEMFNKDGSSVEMIGAEHSPGMEVHNGTLGIGLSTAAGLAYGPWWGFTIAMVGAAFGMSVTFFVGRRIGGKPLARVKRPRIERLMAGLQSRPQRNIALMRLVVSTAPWLNYLLALTAVHFRHYFWGSVLGIAVPVFATTWFSDWILQRVFLAS